MTRFLIFVTALVIIAAAWWFDRSEPAVSPELSPKITVRDVPSRVRDSREATFSMREEIDAPFWSEADVPDPAIPRPPLPVATGPVKSITPGPSREAVRAAVVSSPALESLSRDALEALNSQLARWHALAPEEAVAWMEEQPSFLPLQDAIRDIAYRHSADNEHEAAAAWAGLLIDQEVRDLTLRDVLGLGFYNGGLDRLAIERSGLPSRHQQDIFNYIAID